MTAKIDHINEAYSQLRISGITVQPTGGHVAGALDRLEDMMAELETTRGVCIGFNFEDEPDANTESGVDRGLNNAVNRNLAIALAVDFGKTIPAELANLASSSMASMVGFVVGRDTRQVQPSSRAPTGSGNIYRNRYYRYERPDNQAPNKCTTNKIKTGELNDYVAQFEPYLKGEQIASYLIEVSAGLKLISDSSTDTAVFYRVEGGEEISQGSHQQALITITTDTGRVSIRAIDFSVKAVDEI